MSRKFIEMMKPVQGLAPCTPSTSTPAYISMKNARKLAIIIEVDNGNTVTGSDISLKQATAIAGTGEKALAFTKMYANTDTGASDTLVETAVSENTFTTGAVNAKNMQYIIEVDASDLDMDNDFDCVRLATGDAANTVLSVTYVLYDLRYIQSAPPSAVID